MTLATLLAAAIAAAPPPPPPESITLATPGAMVEGIAADAPRGIFYASDLYGMRLIRRTSGGVERALRVPEKSGISTLLGLKPSPNGRRLWVCAQLGPEGSTKSAALVEADAATLKLLAVHRFPASTSSQLCNDLDFDGRALIVTESEGGAVWRFDKGRFTRLAADTALIYPNGVAVDPQRRLAFVAHNKGILRIDLATGAASALAAAGKSMFAGIDGLYWRGGSLYGVQNLTNPMRIIRIELDQARTTGTVHEIARGDKRLPLPTTGALVGNSFWAVDDAQFLKLKDGKLKPGERVGPTKLIRYPLAIAPARPR